MKTAIVYIVDRKKDMIIYGGNKIYPREVEEVLYEHPKVAEAVCIGIPEKFFGEVVKAFIVLKDGAEATPGGDYRILPAPDDQV